MLLEGAGERGLPDPSAIEYRWENWMDANRYINVDDRLEHEKLSMRKPHDY
jgi:hypothetical protein